jgi:hypothetical protein
MDSSDSLPRRHWLIDIVEWFFEVLKAAFGGAILGAIFGAIIGFVILKVGGDSVFFVGELFGFVLFGTAGGALWYGTKSVFGIISRENGLRDRYRQLDSVGKLSVWASVATLASLIVAVIAITPRSPTLEKVFSMDPEEDYQNRLEYVFLNPDDLAAELGVERGALDGLRFHLEAAPGSAQEIESDLWHYATLYQMARSEIMASELTPEGRAYYFGKLQKGYFRAGDEHRCIEQDDTVRANFYSQPAWYASCPPDIAFESAGFLEDGTLALTLVMENKTEESFKLARNATLYLATQSFPASSTCISMEDHLEQGFQLDVHAWEEGDAPVMVLEPGETKWATFHTVDEQRDALYTKLQQPVERQYIKGDSVFARTSTVPSTSGIACLGLKFTPLNQRVFYWVEPQPRLLILP